MIRAQPRATTWTGPLRPSCSTSGQGTWAAGSPGRSEGVWRTGRGSQWKAQPQSPASTPGTLTDAAPAILLELELGPALAAMLGHCELDAVVLAATIAHGAGVDGWGPERSQVTPGGRPG